MQTKIFILLLAMGHVETFGMVN